MALRQDLLEILCCPQTKQRLRLLSEGELRSLNTSIKNCTVKNVQGAAVHSELSGALITQDNSLVYPIRSGVPCLISSEALATNDIKLTS